MSSDELLIIISLLQQCISDLLSGKAANIITRIGLSEKPDKVIASEEKPSFRIVNI